MSNLPFLKKKQYNSGGISTEYSSPEPEVEQESNHDEDLKHCAAALIHCINANDLEGVARALKEAHSICELYLHEEGPHSNKG